MRSSSSTAWYMPKGTDSAFYEDTCMLLFMETSFTCMESNRCQSMNKHDKEIKRTCYIYAIIIQLWKKWNTSFSGR